jgi:hypothetical protein
MSFTIKPDKAPSFPFLTDIFTALSMEIEKKERRIKIARFKESKNISCILYAGEEYRRECGAVESAVAKLNEKVKSS